MGFVKVFFITFYMVFFGILAIAPLIEKMNPKEDK
jgi:hypothetical protein